MSLAPGKKVQLKYTGEIGEVVSFPEMGIVQVLLQGNIKIPVNVEDLVLSGSKESNTEIHGQVKKGVIPQVPDDRNIHFSKDQLTKTGIHLVFIPQYNKVMEIIHFDMYLINDGIFDVLFEFELGENNILKQDDGILKSCSAYHLGQIHREIVETHESYRLKIAPVLTSGVEEFSLQIVKLKPKTFFNKEDFAPLMDKLAYIFPYRPDTVNTNDISGLKKLTQETIEITKKVEQKTTYVQFQDPIRRAEFSNELDLHVEALMTDGKKLAQAYLLQLQLTVFDKYIADAIRLGLDRVFIIHGIGSGRLKSEIAKRLDYNPYVSSFKNEFHPAYGFGATEVILS